jgi:thiol-disulfide isomerase/thioredoxin
MRKPMTLLVVLGIAAFLVFAAWLAGSRMKEMPGATGAPLTLRDILKPNVPASRFLPPSGGADRLPVLAEAMPEFRGIAAWLNSGPLTTADLKGKVVLIDFWTYSCINCIRTLPYVTSWHEKYKDKGFTVIGVHTPEFAFEKEEPNVREAIARHRITYPVPLDNGYETWDAYANRYWPAKYLFDAQGRLRYTHFGEGNYDLTERHIQELLEEAGMEGTVPLGTVPKGTVPVEFGRIGTPETYLGYRRMEFLGSPEPVAPNKPSTYTAAEEPLRNRFYFSGTWTVEEERAVSGEGARILYRYSAANANLVMAAEGAKRVQVLLDGKPVPEDMRGADVSVGADGTTYVEVEQEKLYDLIAAPGRYEEHLLELRFLDPGTAAYAFTFG